MRGSVACALALVISCAARCPAQGSRYSLAVVGSFTTSSELFPHPNDADNLVRSQFLPFNDIFGFGVEVRRSFDPLRIEIGLGAEYLSTTASLSTIPNSSQPYPLPILDGYSVIPIEMTGYFPIPIGGDRLRFLIGGGTGVYFGRRIYEYAGTEAPTVEHKVGIGIHIVSDVEVALQGPLAVRGELKFRDVQFETTNQFNRPLTVYRNAVIPLDMTAMPSRINIDGMTVMLGLVYQF